jgi:hypothetical protein
MSPVSALLAILVSGGLLALSGWVIFGVAGPAANVTGGGNTSAPRQSPTGGGNTSAPRQTSTGGQATTASQQLLARVPPSFAATCKPTSVPAADASQGVDAEVVCQPGAMGSGGSVSYVHFREPGAMQNAYAGLTRGLPPGNCTSAAGQHSYSLGSSSQPAGNLACSVNNTGQHIFLWTDSRLAILSIAASKSMTFADLNQWWQGDSGPEPTPRGAG